MAFLLDLLASMIGGCIIIICASLFSTKARWVITALTSRIVGIDIEYVFPNRAAACDDILRELKRATFVNLLTGRGQELQVEPFSILLGERPQEMKTHFRILLPETKSIRGTTDWTAVNEKELAQLDPVYWQGGLLKTQIKSTEKVLSAYQNDGFLEVRHFNCPHIGRVLITNRVAYFTAYNSLSHSRYNPVIKFRRGGKMYDSYARLFNLLWQNAPDAEANRANREGGKPS